MKNVFLNKSTSKDCVVCNRPFSWRKKWEKVWDDVKYCSEKCKRNRWKVSQQNK
ncbi:MAG: DUF2256 domain-containing protein [Ginsengibacter sp.]